MAKITTDEWRAELERIGEIGGDKGETSAELAARLDVSARRMRGILHGGVAAGRYIKGQGFRTNSVGAQVKVPVYRIKQEKKA